MASVAGVTADISKSSTLGHNRGTIAASVAKLSSIRTQIVVLDQISSSQISSTQAARSVSNRKLQTGPPIMEADREVRFGVILSRSMSPAPDGREPAIGNIAPKKSVTENCINYPMLLFLNPYCLQNA